MTYNNKLITELQSDYEEEYWPDSASESESTSVAPSSVAASPERTQSAVQPTALSLQTLVPEALSEVSGSVFARGGRVSCLPDPDDPLLDILEQDGIPIVAKPASLHAFSRLVGCGYPLVLRRPPSYGLSVFAALAAARLDAFYDEDDFVRKLCPPELIRLHEYHVLHLDLQLPALAARVDDDDSDLHSQLMWYCNERCEEFMEDHPGEFSDELMDKFVSSAAPRASDAQSLIRALALYLNQNGSLPLFVIITNFDAPIDDFPEEVDTLESFINALEGLVTITDSEPSVGVTLGGLLLLSTRDDGTVLSCIGRSAAEQPIKPPTLPGTNPRLKHALDLTHHPAFQTCVGFTLGEIEDLDEAYVLGGFQARKPQALGEMVLERAQPAVFSYTVLESSLGAGAGRWGKFNPNPLDALAGPGDVTATPQGEVWVYPPRTVFALIEEKYGPFRGTECEEQ
ncbi:hypothetical protein MKEN_00386500 [Mycena kentingensis (nom. inval.)]|nr:hypothetical protein MKEN_00386500 [Mycena kentingensis (nom. inval.)]